MNNQVDNMKICTACKKNKKLEEFGKDTSSKSGYRSHCRSCRKKHYEYEKGSYDKERYQIRYHNIKKARAKIDELENKIEELKSELRLFSGQYQKYLELSSDQSNSIKELEQQIEDTKKELKLYKGFVV